ncbi:MAG: inorganic phosphate transporter [Candidatus Obscuribacterales bacterium]|nr:inorganic phosphate transporter [Candidatus Obscuribacterales bacterium]
MDFWLVVLVIGLCLVFTFTNGLQDGSSVTAGIIASRALSPARTVLMVAAAEFLGAMFGGSAVANTIGSITSWPKDKTILPVLAAGILAAILWNFLTKVLRFPSSSTHALVGGILGALFAAGGTKYIVWGHFAFEDSSGIAKVILSLFASPLLGFVFGYLLLHLATFLLLRATQKINVWLKWGQCLSVSLLAFGHGANDPQKTMGIILLALNASGFYQGQEIPFWVRLACGMSIVLGVFSLAPGIVKRVGTGIYRIRTLHGFILEAASGLIVLFSSVTGCPVATSQVVASTVIGVGSGERFKDVRWLVAKDILISWLLTIPCSAIFAYCLYICVFRWLG